MGDVDGAALGPAVRGEVGLAVDAEGSADGSTMGAVGSIDGDIVGGSTYSIRADPSPVTDP